MKTLRNFIMSMFYFVSIAVHANSAPVLVIGVAGPSGGGKTKFCLDVQKHVHSSDLAVISMDSYFLSWSDLPAEHYIEGQPNGDHPSALNFDLLIEHLELLKQGKSVQIPRYDFLQDKSISNREVVGPAKVIIVEGFQMLWNPRLRKLLDYTIFVNAESAVRLARILIRDTTERGKEMKGVLEYYKKVVAPMQLQFIEPTAGFSDKQIDGEDSNGSALELAAEIVRYLARVKRSEYAFFFDREITSHKKLDRAFRGETIQQTILEQGKNSVLVVGGSMRPPTLDHMSLMLQTMLRFGFSHGKFMPANAYKAGAIGNAAAMLLSRVAVEHFNEALDDNGISYKDFAYNSQSGARWSGKDGKQHTLRVDSSEIDVTNPVVEGEDRRTLMAFEALKSKAGGDPKSVFWLAGGDSFASLKNWNKNWREHLDLANWIVVSRPEFEGKDNNVSFDSHDPIRFHMPNDVMERYTYYFDYTSQTHVYENKNPALPNIYVIRLARKGFISSSTIRASMENNDRVVARAGTTKSVFEACLNHGFFEAKTLSATLGAPSHTCSEALSCKNTINQENGS